MTMKTYTTGQFAKAINKSPKTIQTWDLNGKLKAHRTPTNRRYYLQSDVNKYFGKSADNDGNTVVLYGRIDGDDSKVYLKRKLQLMVLKQYAKQKHYKVSMTLFDVGSGLDYNRQNWNKIIQMVLNGDSIKVVVTDADRFIESGFNWFSDLFKQYHSQIEVMHSKESTINSIGKGSSGNEVTYKNLIAFHPGAYVEEIIDDLNVTPVEFAKRLGIKYQTLQQLLTGEISLDNDLVIKLANVTGVSTTTWLNLQHAYDKKLLEIKNLKQN